MPKYDAFGREVGEDTLAGLGGTRVEPEPVAAPPAPAFEAPAARVRRRGGAGCLVGLIVLAVIAAAPIIAIVSIVGSAGDAIDDVRDAIDSVPDDVVPAIPEGPGPPDPPSGIAGRSLVARGNFAGALERLGGMGGATLIRLAPERIDAQLVKGSRQRSVQVGFQGTVERGPATRGGGPLSTIPLSAIDPGAPARLVRGSAARYAVRPRGINYLIMIPWPGEGHRWIAYFRNGIYVQGDRSGRVVRRIS